MKIYDFYIILILEGYDLYKSRISLLLKWMIVIPSETKDLLFSHEIFRLTQNDKSKIT